MMPKIDPPEGYTGPDDKMPGDRFQFSADAYFDESGKLCIESIDGVSYAEDKPKGNRWEGKTLDDAMKAMSTETYER